MNAELETTVIVSVLTVVTIVIFAGVVWMIYRFVKWYNKAAEKALTRIVSDFDASLEPKDRDVQITYHTYSGIFFHVTQIEHNCYLPPEQAKDFLRRLRNYSLKWAILSQGCLFVPFLAFGNYTAQLKRIDHQIRERCLNNHSSRPC